MRVADTQAAQANLMATLRKQPNDVDARMQLFRYCVIDGNWERARAQLDVASRLDASLEHTAMVYRHNIACEQMRHHVFGAKAAPIFIGSPPPWMGTLVQALQRADSTDGAALVGAAMEAASPMSGTVNGEPFIWLADADSRLGPTLEAFIDGNYYWLPFEHVASIALPEPDDMLDLAWYPAEITLVNGGVCHAYIPTRYPGTDAVGSDELKLARLTEWIPWAEQMQKGLGQRMFVSDSNGYALLDCREIRFDSVPHGTPS